MYFLDLKINEQTHFTILIPTEINNQSLVK